MNIDCSRLVAYFTSHTLKQCASEFGCAPITVKRKLKELGVDTSLHNHSSIAYAEFIKTRKDTSVLTPKYLYNEYLIANKDAKTIAESLGLHFNTVRSKIRKYGLKKPPKHAAAAMQLRYLLKTGYRHPGCNPETIKKINKAKSRYGYGPHLFKSLHELSYALLLDSDTSVENWDYELIRVPYADRLTGKQRTYFVDFSVQSPNGDCWIEVKPAENMIPLDKYLYASQAAKNAGAKFRGVTAQEREAGYELFLGGFNANMIEFVNPVALKPETTYTLWFKSKEELSEVSHEHHYAYSQRAGCYYKCKFIPKSKNKARSNCKCGSVY